MKIYILTWWIIWLSVGVSVGPVYAQQDGAYLFETYCVICHKAMNGEQALGPELDALRQMTPEHILEVLKTGSMQSQAKERSRAQRYILAEYLSGKSLGSTPADVIPQSAYCSSGAAPFSNAPTGPAWNGWGAAINNARFQPEDAAGLRVEDVPRLKLKWAFGYPGATSGGTQPVVVGGRLYVGTAEGDIFSLDAQTGCVYWRFQADAGVRSAISVGKAGSDDLLVMFGDQAANTYALKAETGTLLWKKKIDDHPLAVVTGAPTLYEGILYVPISSREESQVNNPRYSCCQFRGSMVALDASSGNILWKTFTIQNEAKPIGKNSIGTQFWGPSGAPIWVAPTIDIKRNVLYVGTGNNYSIPATNASEAIIAFDLDTGAIRWIKQVIENDIWNSSCRRTGGDPYTCPDVDAPDADFADSPILVHLNGRDVLFVGNKLGTVYSLDPDQKGKIIWQQSSGKGSTSGGIMWGLAVDGVNVYAANNYFRPSEPEETTGGITAFNLMSGREVWSVPALPCAGRTHCKPSTAAAVTAIPGVVFSGSMDGRLRALSSRNGKTLWEVDTAREYTTINGIKANGGSMSQAGVTVVSGMLYTNSGYSHHGAIIPGNVLLAFSVE